MNSPEPILLKLTTQTAISHGDPGVHTEANVTPFRMIEVLYPRAEDLHAADDPDTLGEEPEELRLRNLREAESAIAELAASYPLPVGSALATALQQLQAKEFLASAFIYSLISQLNRLNEGDGIGLFSGKSRYDQLLKRLSIVGSQYQTSFFCLYASLLRELHVESTLWDMTDLLWRYAALPRSVQQAAIETMTGDKQSVVTIARAWYEASRKERTLERTGEMWDHLLSTHEYYNPAGKYAGSSLIDAEAAIPWISSNSFRHNVFRQTLRDHLFATVGLGSMEEAVNAHTVPPHVAMLFSNGGNVHPKVTVPDNTNAINAAIFRLFPSLELVGGCLPTHIMAGKLSLPVWTLCVQNNQSTRPYGFVSDTDAASLLTSETFTRHTPDGMANDKESGQMIYGTPLLKQGVHLLMQISLAPWTSYLACGAAYFAVKTWLRRGGQVGGVDRQGFGRLMLSEEVNPSQAYYHEAAAAYEQYIESHAEQLDEELRRGTLGWSSRPTAWN